MPVTGDYYLGVEWWLWDGERDIIGRKASCFCVALSKRMEGRSERKSEKWCGCIGFGDHTKSTLAFFDDFCRLAGEAFGGRRKEKEKFADGSRHQEGNAGPNSVIRHRRNSLRGPFRLLGPHCTRACVLCGSTFSVGTPGFEQNNLPTPNDPNHTKMSGEKKENGRRKRWREEALSLFASKSFVFF